MKNPFTTIEDQLFLNSFRNEKGVLYQKPSLALKGLLFTESFWSTKCFRKNFKSYVNEVWMMSQKSTSNSFLRRDFGHQKLHKTVSVICYFMKRKTWGTPHCSFTWFFHTWLEIDTTTWYVYMKCITRVNDDTFQTRIGLKWLFAIATLSTLLKGILKCWKMKWADHVITVEEPRCSRRVW